jgi:hypothetical protein
MALTHESRSLVASLKLPSPEFAHREWVVALFDFTEALNGELCFKKGDQIELLESAEDSFDWWKGKSNQTEGWFPANYVERLDIGEADIISTQHGSEKWERKQFLGTGNFGKV